MKLLIVICIIFAPLLSLNSFAAPLADYLTLVKTVSNIPATHSNLGGETTCTVTINSDNEGIIVFKVDESGEYFHIPQEYHQFFETKVKDRETLNALRAKAVGAGELKNKNAVPPNNNVIVTTYSMPPILVFAQSQSSSETRQNNSAAGTLLADFLDTLCK